MPRTMTPTMTSARHKRTGSHHLNVRQLLQSKAFTIGAVFAIVIISISLVKEIIRKVEVNQQISELEQQIADLQQHNAELGDLMQYFNSSSFQEKEASEKLGLKKEGERVVLIPGNQVPDSGKIEV